MIDTIQLSNNIDMLALVGVEMQEKAANGHEYASPCPMCGGRDRFVVQPEQHRWLCRNCTDGQWRDPIAFIMMRDRVDFLSACKHLSDGYDMPTAVARNIPNPELASPPAEDWQLPAMAAIQYSADYLRDPSNKTSVKVWQYLQKQRGLTLETINAATIGFNPNGRKFGGYWLHQGITIPSIIGGDIWSINVRTNGDPKYRAMAGSHKTGLYRANTLKTAVYALVVESEFDALLIGQYLPEGWTAVASGGATMKPDRWITYMGHLHRVVLAFDSDQAGQEAARRWSSLLSWAEVAAMPTSCKDIGDFHKGGGSVPAWLETAVLTDKETS